jgi:quinol monooxygenase YgiN
MKIVTITSTFDAVDVAQAFTCLKAAQIDAQKSDDCLKYEIYRDGDGKIFVIHMWSTDEAFEAYRTSETFGQTIEYLKPLMTSPPESLSWNAPDLDGTAFAK